MTDERLDDRVLLAVRAARPASPAGADSSSSPEARLLLERALASHPRQSTPRQKRGRLVGWAGWAVPAMGVLAAIAVVVVALAALGRSHRPAETPARLGSAQTPPTRSGPAESLSPAEYAFAIGGDTSTRTSTTQASSGLLLFRADQVLRERCMRQRGFHYVPDPTPATSDLPSVTGYPSTFYPQPLLSAYSEAPLLALRERDGFAVNAGSTGNHTDPDPDDLYLKTLSPARQQRWRNAWMGQNGCYGTAETQLFGSRHAANLEQQVPVEIYNYINLSVYTVNGAISPSNPSTANAAAAWSRCMQTTTGHIWADENALISGIGNDYTRSAARGLAVTDTKCAYSTGQARAFAAAFRHAATHLPVDIQTELRFLLTHRPTWIAEAKNILMPSKP